MASAAAAASRTGGMHLIGPVFIPALAAGAAYTWWRVNWKIFLREFFTGQGRNSRVLMLLFFLLNLKSMPLAWTVRVFNAFIYHTTWGKAPVLGPRGLFAPMVSKSHAPLLEVDYNMHKSNSTYFSDLDVSRSHLVTYLTRPALGKLKANVKTKIVLDPAGNVARGETGVMLGAVQCSFRREIAPYAGYEMWSRILAWDRKWLYIVTHFVPKGVARPTEWLDRRCKKIQTRKAGDKDKGQPDWSKKVYATAISRYVFKIGRLTVHPAIVLEQSHLLPPRPGGWRGGEDDMGEQPDLDDAPDGQQWDWRRVERERRKGMEYASHFLALDGMEALFDGGSAGAIGKFSLG